MFLDRLPDRVQVAASEALAGVVADHLRSADPARGPVLVQVDGLGKSRFLGALADALDPERGGRTEREPWTTIEFDAWQHQRVAPPWWWLIAALDKQLRARFMKRGPHVWLWKRLADLVGFRGIALLKDLFWVVPGAVFLVAAWYLWQSKTTGTDILGVVSGLGGAVTAVTAFTATVVNAFRRDLLARSPLGANAALRTSDPMEDLRKRYRFLLRTAGRNVLFLIENLDRCTAEYVVEMLEGIQTLLRPERVGGKTVAFVVAADEGWLCQSYVKAYSAFTTSAREPGRPFGLGFVDKIFKVSLHLPTIPAGAKIECDELVADPFASCDGERAVRDELAKQEAEGGPRYALRIAAVRALGRLEVNEDARQCSDTDATLNALRDAADLGPVVENRLDTAYCGQRTLLLLGGYEFDHDELAIERLALWTMLSLRWPLLAEDLQRHPERIAALRDGAVPDDLDDEDLKLVFAMPAAVGLAQGLGGVSLTPDDIVRFTTRHSARPTTANGKAQLALTP